MFSHQELLRYHRQISLKDMDIEGQEKLKKSRILIIGLGGLGCAASQYLASSGVGRLSLLDYDSVELSNLHRQILHHDEYIGMPKVTSAKIALTQINPLIAVEAIHARLDDEALYELVAQHDLILECTDSAELRLQLNRLCLTAKKPWFSASVIRMEGTLTFFHPDTSSPCYQCFQKLFTPPQLSCVESGVLAPLVGVIGNLQALEALKWLTHKQTALRDKVLFIDGKTLEFRHLNLKKQTQCPACYVRQKDKSIAS